MIYSIIYNLKLFSDEYAKQLGYELNPNGYLTLFFVYLGLQLFAYAVYYVFRSLGLYTMANRKGIANPKRVWIPFYGIFIAHKLAPDSKYVKKVEAWWVLAVVFAGISTLSSITTDVLFGFSNLFKIIGGGVPTAETLGESSYLLAIVDVINYLSTLAFVVFFLFVLRNLFMSYTLKNNFMLTAFSAVGYVASSFVLFGGGSLFLAGIFIFALRKKPRIDYTAYVESRRRFYNPYGGNPNGNNPYGNTYSNGQSPYFGNHTNQNTTQQDPFEEFSSDGNTKGGDNSQNGDGDDFFN